MKEHVKQILGSRMDTEEMKTGEGWWPGRMMMVKRLEVSVLMKVHFWQLTVIIMGWNNNIRCETSRDLQKRQFYLANSWHICFNWRIVDLQRCVSFRCATKWFSFICVCMCMCVCIYIYIYIYIHAHTHIFFCVFFPIIGYYKILSTVPCAIQ